MPPNKLERPNVTSEPVIQADPAELTTQLAAALTAILESGLDEKARIRIISAAVHTALTSTSSRGRFTDLLDNLENTARVAEGEILIYTPDLGDEKLNSEFIGFLNTIASRPLQIFYMAAGKFNLGTLLTYPSLDDKRTEILVDQGMMGENLRLTPGAIVVNRSRKILTNPSLPFYFEIASRFMKLPSKKTGGSLTFLKLCRAKTERT